MHRCRTIPFIHYQGILWQTIGAILSVILIVGCDTRSRSSNERFNANHRGQAPTHKVFSEGEIMLSRAAVSAEQLRASIEQFLDSPTPQSYSLVRELWIVTLRDVESLHLFSLLSLPPHSSDPSITERPFAKYFSRLSSWPIEPGFLDGFDEHPFSGIIFDISTPLTEENLRDQHHITSTREASIGVYALGTILFGLDNTRPADTFMTAKLTQDDRDKGYQSAAELPNNRRRTLAQLQADILANDLSRLATEFGNKTPDNPLMQLAAMSPTELRHLFQRASLEQVTQQLTAIAQQQKANNNATPLRHRWQNYVLAERLLAQTKGWLFMMDNLNRSYEDSVIAESRRYQAALVAMTQVTHAPDEEKPITHWKMAFQHLRSLSKRLKSPQ